MRKDILGKVSKGSSEYLASDGIIWSEEYAAAGIFTH